MSTTEHDLVGGRPRRRRDLRADHAAADDDLAADTPAATQLDADTDVEADLMLEDGALDSTDEIEVDDDADDAIDPGVIVVPYSVGDATAELMLGRSGSSFEEADRDTAGMDTADSDTAHDAGEHRSVIDLSEFSPPHGVAVIGPPLADDESTEPQPAADSDDLVALFERFGLSESVTNGVVADADDRVADADELVVDAVQLDDTLPLSAADARQHDARGREGVDPLEALRRSNIDGPTVRMHPQDDPSVQRRSTRRPVDYNPAPNPIPTPVPRLLGRKPRVRKVTRVVRHVDPWSVFKVAFIAHLVLYVILLTAGVLLWNVAEATGTIDNVERFLESFGWSSFEFRGEEIFRQAWVGGLFVVVGLTGLAVLVATLFNLITDLVGGVRFTVLEEEVVERRTSSMRRFVLRRAEPPVPAKVETSAGLAHREALVDDVAGAVDASGLPTDRSNGAGVNGGDSR